jgi:fructose-1,6-bisphosphatase I
MAATGLLQHYLDAWARDNADRQVVATLIGAIAAAGVRLSRLIATRELETGIGIETPTSTAEPAWQPMPALAHKLFADALSGLPVSLLVSAQVSEARVIDPRARYAVAIDPLDGAANLETNQPTGSIFSIVELDAGELVGLKPGKLQRAAGFLYYGPQTRLVLSCGEGTHQFLLDPAAGQFHRLERPLSIPAGKHEFAINTANYRFWDCNLRHFIDDCIAGEEGALGKNFNMRWSGALVAEAFRILLRGGVFLYPGDARPNYRNGRLRLLYHALPLALIIEQAGGAASDGNEPILAMRLGALHARVPLVFGCRERVAEVIDYISGAALDSGHHPLFLNRGLLRN